MAKMNPRYRLKGSTLLESLIAMILLLIYIILATGVINNIIQSSNAIEKFKASLLTMELMNQTKIEERFIDEDFPGDQISLEKRVTKYQDCDDIIMIDITALSSTEKVLSHETSLIKMYP